MLKPNIDGIRPRARLLRQLREFFDSRGFLEVQPPCLSRDCIIDAFIDPIEVESEQFRLAADLPARYYLQTSPEATMKRMLAAGAPSIYAIGPVFRSGERGDLHNLEFTMLEWYEVGGNLESGVQLLGELAMNVVGSPSYDVRDYRQIFQETLSIDPIDTGLDDLRAMCARIDVGLTNSIAENRDELLDALLSHFIQPTLGMNRPLVVKNYPLSQAALARAASDDLQCAARFELFVDGIEIANGYDELCDADILIERFERSSARRHDLGKAPLQADLLLIDAMRQGLPPCAGVAVGVDRLLMVQTKQDEIGQVMPFTIETA